MEFGATERVCEVSSTGHGRARRASLQQRFQLSASASSMKRFYRLCRACCAWNEHLHLPFEGALECDETTFRRSAARQTRMGAAGEVIVFGIVKRNGLRQSDAHSAHNREEIVARDPGAHTKARCTVADLCDAEDARPARHDPRGEGQAFRP